MSKRFKPYIIVRVTYDSDFCRKEDPDQKLIQLAAKYSGKDSGSSGYGMGGRDYGLEFNNLLNARKFYLHIKKFKGILEVGSEISLDKNDYS